MKNGTIKRRVARGNSARDRVANVLDEHAWVPAVGSAVMHQ